MMKLCLSFCVALSLLANALSSSPDDYTATAQFEDFAAEQFFPDVGPPQPMSIQDYDVDQLYAQDYDYDQSNTQDYDADQPNTQDYTIMQGNGKQTPKEGEEELPAKDMDELKKQMERKETETPATAQLTRAVKNVMQGSYIAIRSNIHVNRYLTCPVRSYYCSTGTCPNLFMEGADWVRCRENVFQVFHSCGRGPIRVGDFVGLYSPIHRRWFSMYTNKGHKQTCPGQPHAYYGFHARSSWFHCGAEIFRIFAKGKRSGSVIEDGDTISLYYPAARGFVQLGSGIPTVSTCVLRNWRNQILAYDICYAEVFEITVR